MSNDKMITVELSRREVTLLLRYGCPFENESVQLNAFKNHKGPHWLQIEPYYLPLLVGDLVHSAKMIHSDVLLEELDILCTALENAAHSYQTTGLISGQSSERR